VREIKALGYGVYLCSNATSTANEYFPRIPGSECFEGTVFSADVKLLKPQHEIYELMFETFGLKPDECFFIDDSPTNVDGAYAVGMSGAVFQNDMVRLRTALRTAGIPVTE
jgi:putative hydrolase of the HAD superfamily